MVIYLGGKIGAVDWRWLIVRGIKEHIAKIDPAVSAWPILEGSIYGIHDCSGPWFTSIDKSANPDARPAKVHRLCLDAIDRSDMVYSWVDDPTCYATIYEMGYAQAQGKYTAVAYPPDFDKSELWFMSACSDEIIEATSPEMGLLASVMKALKSGKLQNPIAELERVEKNLDRLNRPPETVNSFDSEPPTNPQTIESKKKSGDYPAVRPEEKEGQGNE